jgi:hypothetical protein
LPCEIQRGFHRASAYHRAEAVVAIDERRGGSGWLEPDDRVSLDDAGLNPARVHGEPHHPVGIHAAQFGLDQTAGDFAGLVLWNVETLQDSAAEVEQVLMPIASWFHDYSTISFDAARAT